MKNGFTLIELVMVILLLGLIAIITVPTVNQAIKNSKIDTYERQVETIENTARTYMSKHSGMLPSQSSNEKVCITVSELQKAGLLSKDKIINPNYKENGTEDFEKYQNFEGAVKVTWSGTKYLYKYTDNVNC